MASHSKYSFQRGNEVEVCSKEDGFRGSYFEATVVANMGTNYVVEYKNLVEERDHFTALKETVMADEVRPVPPEVTEASHQFHVGDRVDVFDLDGWWVGTVTTERNSSGNHYVYFESTGQELDYPEWKLRIHQEWRHGKWVVSSKKSRGPERS